MRIPAQFLAVRMINHWNKLPSEAVDSQSLSAFESQPVVLSPEWMSSVKQKILGLIEWYLITLVGWSGPADFGNQTWGPSHLSPSPPTQRYWALFAIPWRGPGMGMLLRPGAEAAKSTLKIHFLQPQPLQGPRYLLQPSLWHPVLPDASLGTGLESCLAKLAQGLFGNKSGLCFAVALLATFCSVC